MPRNSLKYGALCPLFQGKTGQQLDAGSLWPYNFVMKRDVKERISAWVRKGDKALLVSGARQVGKTYIIRKTLEDLGVPFCEINFILNQQIKRALDETEDIKDIIGIFKRSSLTPFPDKGSVVFLDEIQAYPDILTKIKFLVDEGSFKYVLSGSLLGVELNNVRSLPVGYLTEIKMFPMSLFEFARGNGLGEDVLSYLSECFEQKKAVDASTHDKMLNLFYAYLVSGGMPDVVNALLRSGSLMEIQETQRNIINLYKGDFSQYESRDRRLRIIEIFDNIPAQLNKQNLKFVFSYLNKELKFDRYENSFLWLKDSGVAYPVFDVSEVRPPLLISKEKNSFKLFMNDVGLLNSYYSIMVKQAIFERNADRLLNLGGLFESFVCSALKSNGFEPFYYRSHEMGEIDFLVEKNGKIIPIEVKSGRDNQKHASLNKLLLSPYAKYLSTPYVLSTNNLEVKGGIVYLPIYMCDLIKRDEESQYRIKIDL